MCNRRSGEPTMSLPYSDADTRRRTVLVVVLNNLEDLHRAAVEGWYRIPQRRAPRRIGADFLAFYQTGAFRSQAEAQTVTYYAPTRRYRLLTRRDCCRTNPIIRAPTTTITVSRWAAAAVRQSHPCRTLAARHLYPHHVGPPADCVRRDGTFRVGYSVRPVVEHAARASARPLRNRLLDERPVDLALRARGGYLGVNCVEDSRTLKARARLQGERWKILSLPTGASSRTWTAVFARWRRAARPGRLDAPGQEGVG